MNVTHRDIDLQPISPTSIMNITWIETTAGGYHSFYIYVHYRGADKSLARPGRKQATATEDFEFHYPIYNNNNGRNISTIYICNKASIKRDILTIKQNASGNRSG
jgi:hypothetical protein